MNPTEILKAARAKIENPENWCKVDDAQTRSGHRTEPNDPNAAMFCSYGAVRATFPMHLSPPDVSKINCVVAELHASAQELFRTGMYSVNDCLGHPQVLQMFDKAIENANS